MNNDLPIHAVLPELLGALRQGSGAVLVAPPGAGKTTAVAPALLNEDWCTGTVILTSPRRVAARAAAERMAETLGEKPGETIGYLTRLDSKRSARTRVLVVTEAIFVNTILSDPELSGISAVLFDEAHERHLDSDLGLALALESRAVLRDDLRVLVMSATIDGARFAQLLGADTQVIESAGYSVRDADHPEGDIAIDIIGLRPGEKLEEELTLSTELIHTAHPKIFCAREATLSEIEVAAFLRALRQAVAVGDEEGARQVILRWVEGYVQSDLHRKTS